MKLMQLATLAGVSLTICALLAGCNPGAKEETGGPKSVTPTESKNYSTSRLNIDGSGTVYPIAAAFAEMFQSENNSAQITVGKAGTGAGFEKFSKGEIDIADASRPIKSDEVDKLKAAGIDFIELPVAYDGICIIVHPSNTWLKSITIEQLHKIWDHDSKVTMWSDVDPSWPKEKIKLYGPTDAHGTYEYFNEVVNGKKDNVRADYSQQAEYDPLIQGVANEKQAMGYVGYAYAEQNMEKVRIVPVDNGSGPVEPTPETIASGTYAPFSRPLFMYVNAKSLNDNPLVKDFAMFAVGDKAAEGVKAAQYIPFSSETYAEVRKHLESGKTGSLFNQPHEGKTVSQVLSGQ